MAAVGAVGGAALTEAVSARASAAGGTTVEPGAFAPAVVNLTDATTIAVDASLGNDYRVTIGGNRTMGNPSNPTDGQKLTFQITQGTGGPYTITWGSSYEFSTGLPKPALSPTAGLTDLLGFIYNATKGAWLLAAVVTSYTTPAPSPSPSPSSSPSPSPSPTAGTYRLFPTTNGPAKAVSYSGPFLSGVAFEATTGGCWFEGYWWWVCGSGQSTSGVKCALWSVRDLDDGTLIPGSVVTSGPLTAGQWNYIPLTAPVQLAVGSPYVAAIGCDGAFPDTNNYWGSGQPGGTGITSGPLTAYSAQSGSIAAPYTLPQGVFTTAGSDPSLTMPNGQSGTDNFWVDVQISNTAPSNYAGSYRIWPNKWDASPYTGPDSAVNYVVATEFRLSQPCTLDKIWYYSPPRTAQLATEAGVWSISSQTLVASNSSPTWSGAAASGWVSCSFSGVTLPAGSYRVAVYNGSASPDQWSAKQLYYWNPESSGYPVWAAAGQNGITNGPVYAPSQAQASQADIYEGSGTEPGQCVFAVGPPNAYPNLYVDGLAQNYWVDAEVTPT